MKNRQTYTKSKSHVGHHIKMMTLPHRANHYRPHLIRRTGLLVIILIVAITQATQLFSTGQGVLGSETTLGSSSLLEDTNVARQRNGLPMLALNEKLTRAAQMKARDMLAKQYWAHTAPDGTTPWYWFSAVDYNYSFAGENLAKNFHTAQGVVSAWLASSEHRANVLGAQYSQVGFAIANGTLEKRPVTLVVALYGSPVQPMVAGVEDASPKEQAPAGVSLSIASRFGLALQSISPVVIGSLVLLIFSAFVALLAHLYRNKLPKGLRTTWYKHHGLIKAGGMAGLCLVIVFLYSGGQI